MESSSSEESSSSAESSSSVAESSSSEEASSSSGIAVTVIESFVPSEDYYEAGIYLLKTLRGSTGTKTCQIDANFKDCNSAFHLDSWVGGPWNNTDNACNGQISVDFPVEFVLTDAQKLKITNCW